MPVQWCAYDKFLCQDVGNGLRCDKAAGNDVLLVAGLAGIGVVAVFLYNEVDNLDLANRIMDLRLKTTQEADFAMLNVDQQTRQFFVFL